LDGALSAGLEISVTALPAQLYANLLPALEATRETAMVKLVFGGCYGSFRGAWGTRGERGGGGELAEGRVPKPP